MFNCACYFINFIGTVFNFINIIWFLFYKEINSDEKSSIFTFSDTFIRM